MGFRIGFPYYLVPSHTSECPFPHVRMSLAARPNYAHIDIVVTFLVVKFFIETVITRHH